MKENLSQDFLSAAATEVRILTIEGRTQTLINRLGGAHDVAALAEERHAQLTAADMFCMTNTRENAVRILRAVGGVRAAAKELR